MLKAIQREGPFEKLITVSYCDLLMIQWWECSIVFLLLWRFQPFFMSNGMNLKTQLHRTINDSKTGDGAETWPVQEEQVKKWLRWECPQATRRERLRNEENRRNRRLPLFSTPSTIHLQNRDRAMEYSCHWMASYTLIILQSFSFKASTAALWQEATIKVRDFGQYHWSIELISTTKLTWRHCRKMEWLCN